MSIELPILRLGLAGFHPEQLERATMAVEKLAPAHVAWQVGPFAEADAWWVQGARCSFAAVGVLRVAPGAPTARSLHINLADVDRPMAFTRPAPSPQFDRAYQFDFDDLDDTRAVLTKFTTWLQPLVAQNGLASCLVEHYSALGPGVFDVMLDGRLIAVVDMRGNVGVLPTANATDFADAMWRRRENAEMPAEFARTSLSQLMWQYALRTKRDLLPSHYRTGPLFFRRPPRLPQQVLKDAHLLLLRELAMSPGSFDELQQRTGLVGPQLTRPLAALYYVGSITSNPKRASPSSLQRLANDSTSSSVLPHSLLDRHQKPVPPADLTAPAPLMR